MIISTLLLQHVTGTRACLLGLICGLPVGANLINQQYQSGGVSVAAANILLCICNITSPMFLCGYIWNQTLQKQVSLLYLLTLIYLPIIIYAILGFLYLNIKPSSAHQTTDIPGKIHLTHTETTITADKYAKSKKAIPLEDILLHCLKVILLVGIYIMIFCVCIRLLLMWIPAQCTFARILTSCLEITNGIQIIQQLPISFKQKTALIAGLTSFGGICSILQTKSVLTTSELSIFHYIAVKALLGLSSYALGILLPMLL
jgi:hypothetical protein